MTDFQLNKANLCRYEIGQHLGFICNKIKNEQNVRFTYADPIICMLCRTFGYKLELEDTIENAKDDLSATSKESKADYVCYILTKDDTNQVIAKDADKIPMVILETKCLKTLDNNAIAQVLGYYCKSQGIYNSSQQGLAMLFNGTKHGYVEVRIFLFPYCFKDKEEYGIQSLMLPLYQCKHEDFMESKFLEFILILTHYKPQYLLKLTLPDNIILIKPDKTVLVMIQEDVMKELKEENQQFQK